mmetsp:Transcript_11883/g.27704  ORF Transcript_11883/g.27704 Transcript_11883/m.27704 type:complete len:291 (+) Transcript_11883:235-1107(+)
MMQDEAAHHLASLSRGRHLTLCLGHACLNAGVAHHVAELMYLLRRAQLRSAHGELPALPSRGTAFARGAAADVLNGVGVAVASLGFLAHEAVVAEEEIIELMTISTVVYEKCLSILVLLGLLAQAAQRPRHVHRPSPSCSGASPRPAGGGATPRLRLGLRPAPGLQRPFGGRAVEVAHLLPCIGATMMCILCGALQVFRLQRRVPDRLPPADGCRSHARGIQHHIGTVAMIIAGMSAGGFGDTPCKPHSTRQVLRRGGTDVGSPQPGRESGGAAASPIDYALSFLSQTMA